MLDQRFARTDWFRHDRFGLFIHFGAYSVAAGEEWMQSCDEMTVEEYQPYVDAFQPDLFDAAAWADHAVATGVRYAVMGARHHEGFALWDTQVSDFGIMHNGFGRDLVREYVDAFRSRGIKVGLYYSLIDWHHPDYVAFGDWTHPRRNDPVYENFPHDWDRYVDFMHAQVRELCTNYGHLDLIWFDMTYPGDEKYHGRTPEDWRADELLAMVRELQGDIVVNNRLETSGHGFGSLVEAEPTPYAGDFVSPEQVVPADGITNVHGDPVPWEACFTHNNHWGYHSTDRAYKAPAQLVRKLVECVSKGGNVLLNVGPTPRGEWPEQTLADFRTIGKWLRVNGESVYGAGPAGLPKPDWGYYTRHGDRVYAHVLEAPIGPLPLVGIDPSRIQSMRWLGAGAWVRRASSWVVHAYPDQVFASFGPDDSYTYPLPDPINSVLVIDLLPR